jgi:hypothetical protein
MRKIDKTDIHAEKYRKEWETWQQTGEDHPEYTSKADRYLQVKLSLLISQRGLCAYTEQLIVSHEVLELYSTGQRDTVSNSKEIKEWLCQLDHFDPNLKKERGWEWDNFFAVNGEINHRKGVKEVDPILKPDSPEYDPFKLLAYDTNEHRYCANPFMDTDTQKRIENMIDILGLNNSTIVSRRSDLLRRVFSTMNITKQRSKSDTVQFPTAYEFGVHEYTGKPT